MCYRIDLLFFQAFTCDPRGKMVYAKKKICQKVYRMLQGKKIVFSGFRNQVLKDRIEKAGGKVTSAVSSLTNILVVKNKDATSSKVEDAQQKGIVIHDVESFIATYLKNNAQVTNSVIKKKPVKPKVAKPPVLSKAYASYYDVSSKNFPHTIEASEAWLQQNMKKAIYLQHGDIVNFSVDRFGEAKIVVTDNDGKRRFVDNPDYSGSGYLSIPKTVTLSLEDAVKYYKKVAEELDGSLTDIVIGPNDKRFKKIFKKETEFSKEALVVYVLYEQPFLRVEYKGKSEQFELNAKQDHIEARMKALSSPTRSINIRFYLTAELATADRNKRQELSAKLSPNLVGMLSLPEGVQIQKQTSSSITVVAPLDKVWETSEAISKNDYTIGVSK
jgi:hypothetical protein